MELDFSLYDDLTDEELKKIVERRCHTLVFAGYANVLSRIIVKCSKGHQYELRFCEFLYMSGCPFCKK